MAGDILKALARYGIDVSSGKAKFYVCCPVHAEKTPSCHIDLNKQEWHCFGCNAGGDAVALVMKRERVTFPDALRILGIDDQARGAAAGGWKTSGHGSARPAGGGRQNPFSFDDGGQAAAPTAAPSDQLTEDDQKAIRRAATIYRRARPLKFKEPAAWYCEARGISAAVAANGGAKYEPELSDWEKIGDAWKEKPAGPAVLFPVYDQGQQLTAVLARYLFPAPAENPDRPDKKTRGRVSRGIFVSGPGALLDHPAVIVTEAPFDALALAVCGFPALALGGTSFPAWLPAMIGARPAYLATDNDNAGDGAAQALCNALAASGGKVYRLKPDGAKDWNAYLCAHGPAAMEAAIIAAAFPDRRAVITDLVDTTWREHLERARLALLDAW